MKKPLFAVLLLLAILSVGCGGTSTPTVAPTSAPAVSAENTPASTNSQPQAPAATQADSGSTAPISGALDPFEPVSNDGTPIEGCTLSSVLPPPDPAATSRFPPVSENDDWIRGPSNATVTVVEYSDFQCVGCGQLALILNQLQQDFPNDLRIVFRPYPQLNSNDKAGIALQAATAAGQQGKFWEMHDVLFTRQQEWSSLSAQDFQNWLNDRANEIGLNSGQYSAAMFSPELTNLPQQAYADAFKLEMPGVPFLLINGQIYDGPTDYTNLSLVIKLFALQTRQYSECPPMIIDPAQSYIATIQTEKGDIVVQLFADKAPLAVNNFIFLATHGWYDNVTFHRVLAGFMAQSGDPSGTGFGGPGYAFVNEDAGIPFDREGLLAMANAGPDTNGSQFFITVAPATHLNGGYTIFGEVIQGMDVVKSLTLRDPSQGFNLPPGDKILTITIEQQ